MENIDRTQFVVLTGHLDDQPLPQIIRRLRVQRKSGRLQVEYADAPGSFFFDEGQLVDAQLGALRGVEALYAALSLPGASFNFNPLVRPPERSIDRQGQQFISDLVEAPRREELPEIKVAGGTFAASAAPAPAPLPTPPALHQLGPAPAELLAPLEDRLVAVEAAITSASRRFSRERLIYAVVISFLVGLIVVTAVQAIVGPLTTAPAAATLAGPRPEAPVAAASLAAPVKKEQGAAAAAGREGDAASSQSQSLPVVEPVPAQEGRSAELSLSVAGTPRRRGTRRVYAVRVLVEVERGRVTDASVWNPQPGAGAYESLAVEMAKQRRYPESFTGSERLTIRVRP